MERIQLAGELLLEFGFLRDFGDELANFFEWPLPPVGVGCWWGLGGEADLFDPDGFPGFVGDAGTEFVFPVGAAGEKIFV